ncbi:MAG: S24 family peptidase [Anaerolineales bacterium]
MVSLAALLERFSFVAEAVCIEKERFTKALGKAEQLEKLVEALQSHRREGCYDCESEGGCSIFLGIALLELGHRREAKLKIEEAIQCFRSCSDYWNQINALNLLGWIHEKEGNHHHALHHYREAFKLLTGTYHSVNSYDYRPAPTILKTELEQSISRLQHGPSLSGRARQRLRIGWFPIYARVEATPQGPIWMEAAGGQNCVEAESVVINGKTHTLHSCIPGENSISLRPDKRYGWVEVHGDSMNAATPVPVEEHDFALFYQADDAGDGDIVVAIRADPSGAGYEHFIKRLDRKNKQLLSQTQASQGYPPIHLSNKCKIVGVVVAIAKPV